MYTEDFILRQINIAVAILRHLLRLKQAGQNQQARQEIDQALEILLGLRAGLLKQLEDSQVLNMLTSQDRLDIERLYIIAELYKEEGEIIELQGQVESSRPSFQRALRFYVEAVLADPTQVGAAQIARISALQGRLAGDTLPLETQMALLDYLETLGVKSDAELSAGETSHQAVEAAISELEAQLRLSLD
jgi:tetratricopeptide (TPR) repeat protein